MSVRLIISGVVALIDELVRELQRLVETFSQLFKQAEMRDALTSGTASVGWRPAR